MLDYFLRFLPRLKLNTFLAPNPTTMENWRLWRRLAFLAAMPCVGICMLNVYLNKNEEEVKPRPEFVKYGYLRRREKRFPWGDGNKTLFHNPHINPLPEGYEDKEP